MIEEKLIRISLAVSLALIALSTWTFFLPFIQEAYPQPYVRDARLSVQSVVEGLSFPTSMAFLDDNNILVLEKEGNVRLVSNGTLQKEPVLQVPVNPESERGLLGIAIENSSNGPHTGDVFLYYTEANPLKNRIYKYQWNGQSLINPILILDLPGQPGPDHDGGKIITGPDGYLYVVIGDVEHDGQLQNFPNGPPPDDTGSIFRINPEDGSPAPDNPFAKGGNDTLNKYYAYGIRNSFGLDFDPVTHILWDTENGEETYDEINIVKPGFNSGWEAVMGPISRTGISEKDLVHFPGSHYANPLFSWKDTQGITDIEFFNSSRLGERYTNNIFVGDISKGNLYFFEVNESRDGVKLNSTQQKLGLSDLVVDNVITKGTNFINEEQLDAITFGGPFGGITDIETGPDGLLYVLSFNEGKIYRISQSTNPTEIATNASRGQTTQSTDEPFVVAFAINEITNDTGFIINWVTANNVTSTAFYNASLADLTDPRQDGYIESYLPLPNGTMNIFDSYLACTMVPSYMYLVCDEGVNSPINRPEFTSVTIPMTKEYNR